MIVEPKLRRASCQPLAVFAIALAATLAASQSKISATTSAAASAPSAASHGAWLFIYFKEPGNQGIYFALSHDGLHYAPLNDGQPWGAPSQSGELMRDVFLTRGPKGQFQMVWTWNWRGNSLGHASSPDLLSWSEQKEIPIMAT